MKKGLNVFLALMCLASVGLAKDKSVAYREQATRQISKIMQSNKSHNEKMALLSKYANKLSSLKNLSAKQTIELQETYSTMAKNYYTVVKDYEKAAYFFDKAIEMGDSGLMEFYKGNCLFFSKQYKEALETFRKAEKMEDLPLKNYSNLLWLIGCSEFFTGDYSGAVADFKKMLVLDETKWQKVANYMVTGLQKCGEHDEALAWTDRMVAGNLNKEFALRRRADIFCEAGRYEDCADAIGELETNFPLDDAIYLLKAQLSFAKGDFEEVTRQLDMEFARPNRKNTYDYECYIMRAQIALQAGNHKDALDFVDKAVREPMPPYSTKLRGDIYYAMGEKLKALGFYNEFLKISPSVTRNEYVNGLVNKIQAEVLEEMGRPENQ